MAHLSRSVARSLASRSLAVMAGVFAFAAHAEAQFVRDSSGIPNEASSSENVDFGDIDGDGDWDAVIADGGDDGNDQNRVWINNGGAQSGTLGTFSDQTSTRYPSFLDDSRDIEFVDFDDDGDLDLYVSNTAQISNQGNRWLTNNGAGVYSDTTGLQWVGLGGAGSSIAPSLVLPAGSPGGGSTFIDFSCDCDFGDLDNDGDLDLVHSSYGGAFGGQIPTRLFLNDGAGLFEEFNPGGFQLPVSTISNGQSGLWCDGTQSANTTNSDGTFCDIATSALDIDVGDIDGDFDLDILHGSRQTVPRMFANRLDASGLAPANGGALGFRDVTGAVFPSGYSTGDGHYEQEMGDLDGDGDLDIYGLNWAQSGFTFNDITLRNDGAGTFSNIVLLGGSSADDNEGDFLDYDNDGDLDLFVANFSGRDKLYRNNNNGGSSFSFTQVSFPDDPFGNSVSLDGDACDIDGDGDYDVLVSMDNLRPNLLYINTTQVPDTHAPYIPNVEDVGAQAASNGTVPVRAQVYDNAPYYITWYNETEIEVSVEGVPLFTLPAKSSAGQIFRAELPGNLNGAVSYAFRSADEYGNTGTSAATNVTYTAPAGSVVEFGTATAGTLGEPTVAALTVPYPGKTLFLAGQNAPAFTPTIMAVGNTALPSPVLVGNFVSANVLGVPSFLLLEFGATDASGTMLVGIPVPGNAPSGFTAHAQFFSLNGTSQLYAGSKGLSITVQ
ncbi:MAG: VCBS repeat-containing protein [Planctomycetota bacterium]